MVKPDPFPFQGLSLSDGAGNPVQNIALLTVALGYPLHHHADHYLVGNQMTLVHVGLGLLSHLGAGGDGGTKHIARRNRRNRKLLTDNGRLGALSGSRGTQKDQFHRAHPLRSNYSRNPL